MCISIGTIVKTNYGTGPYVIEKVYGPFTGPRPLDLLTNNPRPSLPYYSFTCRKNKERDPYYLNGYNLKNGRILSVWCKDEIVIVSFKPGTQFSLFNYHY